MVHYLALVIVLLAWHIPIMETGTEWIVLCALLAPLLIPFPGLIKGKPQTVKWTLLLLTPYLAYTFMESIANPAARLWTIVTLAVLFMLMVSLVFYLRFVDREPSARTAP